MTLHEKTRRALTSDLAEELSEAKVWVNIISDPTSSADWADASRGMHSSARTIYRLASELAAGMHPRSCPKMLVDTVSSWHCARHDVRSCTVEWRMIVDDSQPGAATLACQPTPDARCGCMCCAPPESEVRMWELAEDAMDGNVLTNTELDELAGAVQKHCDTATAREFGADNLNRVQTQALAFVARGLWQRWQRMHVASAGLGDLLDHAEAIVADSLENSSDDEWAKRCRATLGRIRTLRFQIG